MKLNLTCNRFPVWQQGSFVAALILVLPIAAIFVTAFGESNQLFSHLFSTVMPTYTTNTILLVVNVMLLSLVLGVPTAWLMAMCQLPGGKILQWALVLPLAMPGYIIGYIYTDWFDYAGPVQIVLRQITGWEGGSYWFPDIRTIGGASVVLSLVLYPYVYLMCRAAFMEQSISLLQSARLLNCSAWQSFLRVSLPLARPSIAVGISLVAMETIGDFGTMSYFSVNTLTTAIYDTWLGYSNINAAAKISAIMLLVVLLFLSMERYSRRKTKLFQNQFSSHEQFTYLLSGWKKWLALIWCWGLVLVAFLLPVAQLAYYAVTYFSQSWNGQFHQFAWNSFVVALLAAAFATLIALLVNFNHRLRPIKTNQISMRMASMGYAVPGTILAIGIMVPVMRLDHAVNDLAKWLEWQRPGLIFSGTMFALVFALVVRFSAVAIGSIESGLNKISPSLDMAARTMGYGPQSMLVNVHIPLVRRAILIAMLLVFIESMKELNAALLLRPFNFETLATHVYNYASTEQLELAALPAILLVAVGLLPLILINRSLENAH
jgi:iron(III) transport system permease protein